MQEARSLARNALAFLFIAFAGTVWVLILLCLLLLLLLFLAAFARTIWGQNFQLVLCSLIFKSLVEGTLLLFLVLLTMLLLLLLLWLCLLHFLRSAAFVPPALIPSCMHSTI